MVDINLIGDDKTGEEERVDDFTQTSSMDTQELAFEERTETFDTTKTTGFAQRRSYSSVISTFIIIAIIVLLGSAIYYLMFSDDEPVTQQADLQSFAPSTQDLEEPQTSGAQDAGDLPDDFSDEALSAEAQDLMEQPATIPESEPDVTPTQTVPDRPVQTPPPAVTRNFSPVSGDFLANSKAAVQAVTSLVSSVPSNLNTTLLSYAGGHVRLEFVAGSVSEARNFTDRLNQAYGAGSFKILSEDQVANNGGVVEKVLVVGTIGSDGGFGGDRAQFLTLNDGKNWIRNTAQRFGLQVKQLDSKQGVFAGGYQKIPIFMRLYGAQSSVVSFLEEMGQQNLNFEIAKILLLSPDMVSFSDDNLVLVSNLFLYQQ